MRTPVYVFILLKLSFTVTERSGRTLVRASSKC